MVHFLIFSQARFLPFAHRIAGDVMYLKIFGQSIVVLQSLKAARDLLDKRGSVYSDRPRFVLLSELYAILFPPPLFFSSRRVFTN